MKTWRIMVLVVSAAAIFCLAAGAQTLSPGAKLWAMRYDGPAHGEDSAGSVAASPDGSKVFVTGESFGSNDYDYVTVAYNASTGAKLWSARYDGPAHGIDKGYAVSVSPDGTKVFVTGESYGGPTPDQDYATIAYNASNGSKLWAARYNGAASEADLAYHIAVSQDGTKVFVTGKSVETASHGVDYTTVAYNSSTGSKLWASHYNGAGSQYDEPFALAVSATKVFVTGESWAGSTNFDYATVAYNASTGAKAWSARYSGIGGNSGDNGSAIAVSDDGSKVVVTGQSYGGATKDIDIATIAYNASNGTKLWASRFDGIDSENDFGRAVAVTPDGTAVVVTGATNQMTNEDYVTIGYNASTGAKLWSTRYDGAAHQGDIAYVLALNPDGTKAFVSGTSYIGTTLNDYDYATVAYATGTGSKLWSMRYDGPAHDADVANSIAAQGTSVYVTGYSQGGMTTHSDYATVAYQG